MSEQAAAPSGVEGGAPGADEGGGDALSDASLESAAVAMGEAFSAENAAADGVAAAAAKPAASAGAVPEPGALAVPAPDAAALEAARIEALVSRQLENRQATSRMEARLAALEAENATMRGKLGKLKDSPLEVLEAEGWDPENIAAAMVGQKNPTEVKLRQAMAAIAALKAEREAEVQTAKEAREQAAADATAQANIAAYVEAKVAPALKAGESKYIHLIAEHGGHDGATKRVYGEMDRLWRERQQEFPAEAVAAHLEALAKKRFEAIRDKVMTSPAAGATAKPKPKPTLTNNLTQAGAAGDDDDLSDEALTKKAIEYARLTAS